jgi:integrase
MRRDKGTGEEPHWDEGQHRWRARYTDPRTGRRMAVVCRTPGRAGKQECKRRRDKALRSIADGLVVGQAGQTVEQFCARWLETVMRTRLRPRSFERYEGLVRLHIVPVLGSVALAELTPQHIAGAYASLLRPKRMTIRHARSSRTVTRAMSAESVRYLHAVLHGALQQAVNWRIIADNPATRVTLPAKGEDEMTPLSPDQARSLLDAIRGHPLEALFTLALATGMRQGELLALRWSDIEGDRLHVRHTLARMGGRWWLGEPKTPQSRRTIALTTATVDVLRAHRVRQAEILFAIGHRITDEDLIFTTDAGDPLHGRHVTQRHLRPILKDAGLPTIRFHDLRHTYATLQLAAGTSDKLVAEVLGHKDVQITLNRYSHSLPEMHHEAAARLDAILGR